MATKVLMEALSPTMEEGRLVEWKKAEGDAVTQGDVLAEVETDKAVMELVARAGGVLLKQTVAAGETVPVTAVVGWIGDEGEDVPEDGKAKKREEGKEKEKEKGKGKEKEEEEEGEEGEGGEEEKAEEEEEAEEEEKPEQKPEKPEQKAEEPEQGETEGRKAESVGDAAGRVRASPLARKLAAERGLDLAGITGTGPEGRVVKRDVEAAPAAPAAAPSSRPPVLPSGEAFTDVPLTQIRKTIARRLVQSIGPIPTFYLTVEVDMERAAEAREALRAARGDEGKVSFNDIVSKAVATALAQHPECNAWWQDDHVRLWRDVHLGMAVALPDGLITPVIRHADRKSLREISAESRELATRARERKLKPDEYTGATFTVSNLGMFDIEEFTAVINPPEAGILAIGRMVEKPVVQDGQVQVRRRMRLTMSCDHRVIDGAMGARFLQTLALMLENPLALVW